EALGGLEHAGSLRCIRLGAAPPIGARAAVILRGCEAGGQRHLGGVALLFRSPIWHVRDRSPSSSLARSSWAGPRLSPPPRTPIGACPMARARSAPRIPSSTEACAGADSPSAPGSAAGSPSSTDR